MELTRGSLVGEYEVESLIGEGGMGAVYSAVHPILGKRVAIKVIGAVISKDANAIARFRREARSVAQLESPHIVDVFGFGELADGRAYFVMDHLAGESLRERLARGRVPLDEALDILEQVARGLEAAHETGIVHRDLKPENIFLERTRVGATVSKLLDFGLVKLPEADADVARTQAGVLIGTPVYEAPEQIRDANAVDRRADIYALGCVAYEVILGRVPFDRSTVAELIAAHLECPPPQPRTIWPEVPAALDAVLYAMLAKDPAKRPTLGHVQEVIERLRHAARLPLMTPLAFAVPVAAIATPSPSRRPTPHPFAPEHRRRWPLVVVGAAIAASAFIVVTVLRGPDEQRPRRVVGVTDPGVIVAPIRPAAAAVAIDAGIAPPDPAPMLALPREPISIPVHGHNRRPSSPPAVHARGSATAPVPPAPAAPATGTLEIMSKPPCAVELDGVQTGRHTPFADAMLPLGQHRVTLRNETYRIDDTFEVNVIVDKPVRINKDYSARLHPIDPNGTINPFAGAQ